MAAVHIPLPQGVLRPSSAERWVNCAGSHALEALYPEDEDSPEAREGTAAHFYVTEFLEGRVHGVGVLAPNGHPLDIDMVQNGKLYIDDVMAELASMAPGDVYGVETKVFPHGLVHPENEGTPDTWLVSFARKRAILWDYKYGHKYVTPYHFWQGIDYLAGLFEKYELGETDVRDWAISIRVVQPRNFHPTGQVRTWETSGAVIWKLIEHLSAAAHAAKVPGAPTRTGEWCRDCDARHACPAAATVAAWACDVAGESVPMELPLPALGRELQRLTIAKARLEARIMGLTEIAVANLRLGRDVYGWEMGFVDSQERWRVPAAQVLALGASLGVNLENPKPAPPGEAKKLFKAAGLPVEILSEFLEKPTGAAKLKPVDPTAAAKAFG